jgi:hypothetical protein
MISPGIIVDGEERILSLEMFGPRESRKLKQRRGAHLGDRLDRFRAGVDTEADSSHQVVTPGSDLLATDPVRRAHPPDGTKISTNT